MTMKTGQLVAIVGPSGVGKDSVMEGLKDQCENVALVQRVITRPESAGGENFTGVTEAEFEQLKGEGHFALHWQAHGLNYGIPATIDAQLEDGQIVLFNGSRAALPNAQAKYPDMKIVVIQASVETLAKRLRNRGRESEEDIKRRLQRASYELSQGPGVSIISNDGALEDAVSALKNLINQQEENGR